MKTNMIKKYFTLLLAAIMLFASLPVSAMIEAVGKNSSEPVVTTEIVDVPASSPVETAAAPAASDQVEYEAVSGTMNIVGEVFANAFNTPAEEMEERRASLERYPTEEHEPAYYEDTLRLRYLADGGDEPNYLVYRDSFLIIPEEQSADYETAYSEDGLTVIITPAIPAEALADRTGIVFLHENIGCDEVLVFAEEPKLAEDSVTLRLKSPQDIAVTELFSDGKLEYKGDGSQAPGNQGVSVDFETNPSGTNWEGEITSFEPSWPSASVYVNVWKLKFELVLNLKFDMDFRLHTTGASGGRESVTIAGVHVPIKLFTINVLYKLQTEFYDNVPLEMEGTISTDIDITMSLLFGTRISKYRNPVVLNRLNILDESWVNRDVRFYIGSQLLIQGGFLEISINLWFYTVQIGPVLSLNYDNRGGCYITARLEKDTFTPGQTGQTGQTGIHTCAAVGEAGCIDITIREVHRSSIYFKIDLYFDDWSFYFIDSGEVEDSTRYFYNSLTFNSGIKDGTCPHIFYKVPVAVWQNDSKTQPAPNMAVGVGDSLTLTEAERTLVSAVSDSQGRATIYLPFRRLHCYTIIASGVLDGMSVAGSALQPQDMQAGANQTVNVILHSESKLTIKTEVVWRVDADNKDIPAWEDYFLRLVLLRREAGSNASWQQVGDYINASYENGWRVNDITPPKFGFRDGKAFLYEYRVRIIDAYVGIVTPENDNVILNMSIPAYTDATGNTEPAHRNDFYISYQEERTDDTIFMTVSAEAVMEIRLRKSWVLSDSANKAEQVYLALLQKPAAGWENKAEERAVPDEWVVALDPLGGGSETIKSLIAADVLSVGDDLSSIENRPLAIVKVSDDNSWSQSCIVPKYRSGVRMQYIAYELDSSVMENMLRYEYDLTSRASVKPFGNYNSLPGAATLNYDAQMTAVVVNTDPLPENTISGTIRWKPTSYANYSPTDYVVLTILKDGVKIRELTLNKEECTIQTNLWYWKLTLDDYDPEAEYTVQEYIPFGDEGPLWVGMAFGLNLLNHAIQYESVFAEAQAVFDIPPEDISQIDIGAVDYTTGKGGWDFTLNKQNDWWTYNTDRKKNEVADISNYVIEAPNIAGYRKITELPYAYTNAGIGNLCYRFTVRYICVSDNLHIHIDQQWENASGMPSDAVPQSVFAEVFRDDEMISREQIVNNGRPYSDVVVFKDMDGNSLSRSDGSGKKFIYSVRVDKPDGFIVTITKTSETKDDIYFRVTYTWVGADYMNVAGTVTWEGDEGHEDLRPESVQLSVVNKNEEYVKTVTVPVNSDGRFEAKYLPGHDAEGNELTYSVIESHVYGYTAAYSEPVFDEQTRTWTCSVTNKLTGYYPMTVKKTVEGHPENENEEYKFRLDPKFGYEGEDQTYPQPLKNDLTINGAGITSAEFFIDEDGIYIYSLKEIKGEDEACKYDEAVREVLVVKSTNPDGTVKFKSWVTKEGEVPTDDNSTNIAEFVNRYPSLTIEKEWDIDLEQKDRPDNIEAVVQKKKDGKWETVKLVKLDDDNDWKASLYIEGYSSGSSDYRVRELREETALQELGGRLRELIVQGKEKYDEWISILRTEGKTYWDSLPEDIRNAADEGYDSLLDKLGTTPNNLYEKLMELLSFASADARIVYDEDDSDKGETTNEVTYHVDEYVSVLSGGTEDAHVTKYKVEYKKSGSTYTITNMAILEIDVIKRWIGIGVDDDDMPDSAWVVLMCSPKDGALDSASDLASAAGIDIGGVLDYEFPVINPEEGGKDALTLLSELTIGLDVSMIGKIAKNIFGVKIPELAVAKVDEDCDWKAEFVLSKYNCGVPMDYKGAELWSEVIRQIIKYLIGFPLPVSFNPFDGYISIPTKAIPTILGIENPEDILDLSGLTGKALEKAKSLTMDDISNFGWSTVVDDYHLMANVINIKIDWDPDDDDTLSGSKIWADDDEDKRPDYILIHVKDSDGDIEGSPITLRKSEFAGQDEWTWSIDKPEDASPFTYYYVSEEYPASYEYKDDYTCEIDGLDITNTWHKENFAISGTKIWQDGGDADGIRPETVTIRLLADGVEVTSAVTSRAGDWKYFFPNQPKTKDGRTIRYTVTEDPVPGYGMRTDGYNVINFHYSGVLRISVTRSAEDAAREQSFIFAVEGPDGENALSLEVMIVLAAGETSASAVIKALPAGNYTVEEHSDWSWRYGAASAQTARVELGKTAEVSFGEAVENRYWLDGCGSDGSGSAVAASFTHTAAILPDPDEDKRRHRLNA